MRILIFDGAAARFQDGYAAFGGRTNTALFTETISRYEPGVDYFTLNVCDGERLPQGVALADFDGAVITGSPLNAYAPVPEVVGQLELARELFDAGVPVYGSCWGLQIMTAALGGQVRLNPRGREIGIARAITVTPEGRGHPLFAGKAEVFDAVCSHEDEVERLPAGAVVLAGNRISSIQAAIVERGVKSFWGVQYHPEFDLAMVCAIMDRRASRLVAEGFSVSEEAMRAYVDDLRTVDAEPSRTDLLWRYGIDHHVLDPVVRGAELGNWLAARVRPRVAARFAVA